MPSLWAGLLSAENLSQPGMTRQSSRQLSSNNVGSLTPGPHIAEGSCTVGVIIIKDEVIEAILETGTVYAFVYEDGNVVVLIFVPEVQGYDLCVWRDGRLNLLEEGRGHVLFHRLSARSERAHALATMVRIVIAVANASLASLAVTLRPW